MSTIYKYPLRATDRQSIPLPQGARILSVGLDPNGALCAWALVDTAQPNCARNIWLVGTCNPIPDVPLLFIASVTMEPFVWHAFEEIAP